MVRYKKVKNEKIMLKLVEELNDLVETEGIPGSSQVWHFIYDTDGYESGISLHGKSVYDTIDFSYGI